MKAEQFNLLSPAEKRMEIAKDVLKYQKKELFKANSGTYLEINGGSILYEEDDKNQLNKYILKNKPECSVCAKGALLCAHVLKTNHFSVEDFNTLEYKSIYKNLDGIFSKNQLDLMETAFECTTVRDENPYLVDQNTDDITEIAERAINFGSNYNEDERLTAIMLNIIKNKGEFIP